MKTFWLTVLLLPIVVVHAQSYSIDWYKISGGGGTSSGGNFSVSGTIGQHDANLQPMTGGNYSLTGGFWALLSAVQTPGLPYLTISHSVSGVVVSWHDPATNTFTLQQTTNLTTGNEGWANTSYSITSANGTNQISIPAPTGNLFFRLKP